MSDKIFVTKGALKSMIQRLVKENADPAFITEPPVAAPPIESDPRAEQQVEQGMLPVEDPDWEPETQSDLAAAVQQYISRTPEKEIGDVWKDLKSVIDDAEERGEDEDIEDKIQEAVQVYKRRHGPLVASYVERLLREATDDEWDMGMQGWDPDEVESPFDDYGQAIDLRDTEDEPEGEDNTARKEELRQEFEAAFSEFKELVGTSSSDKELVKNARKEATTAAKALSKLGDGSAVAAYKSWADAEKARRSKTVRKIGDFWRGGKTVTVTVDEWLTAMGLDPANASKEQRNAIYSIITNDSLRARSKLDFLNTQSPGQIQDLQDEATDQWLEVWREQMPAQYLAAVANDPRLVTGNESWLKMYDSIVVNAMAQALNDAGFVGGEREAQDKLGFRGWKGIKQSATTAMKRYQRHLRGDQPAHGKKKKKPVRSAKDAAAARGTSTAGQVVFDAPKLRAMLAHAEKAGRQDMVDWAKAELAKLGEEV